MTIRCAYATSAISTDLGTCKCCGMRRRARHRTLNFRCVCHRLRKAAACLSPPLKLYVAVQQAAVASLRPVSASIADSAMHDPRFYTNPEQVWEALPPSSALTECIALEV